MQSKEQQNTPASRKEAVRSLTNWQDGAGLMSQLLSAVDGLQVIETGEHPELHPHGRTQ